MVGSRAFVFVAGLACRRQRPRVMNQGLIGMAERKQGFADAIVRFGLTGEILSVSMHGQGVAELACRVFVQA